MSSYGAFDLAPLLVRDCVPCNKSLTFPGGAIRDGCLNNKKKPILAPESVDSLIVRVVRIMWGNTRKPSERGKQAKAKLTIECVASAGHLIVEASGDWTEESFRGLIDVARDRAARLGITRIFLDMRAVSRPDAAITRYLSGIYVANTLGPKFRMAALGAPENVTRYGETVARNRGCDFRVFTDDNLAMGWLLHG